MTGLEQWFATPLGSYVLEREQQCFDAEVANIFGFHAVQIGLQGIDFLRTSRISCCLKTAPSLPAQVLADPVRLPFASQSVDLVLLPHVLEFNTTPHALLREVERILMPEGQVLLSGFNPFSLFGLRQLGDQGMGAGPARLISLPRMKDWLKLLDLEVTAGRLCCYAPPVQNSRWLSRLHFLEDAGDRWWALAGGIYFLAAKKRVPGLRLIRPCWQTEKTAAALPKPLVRCAGPSRPAGES